MIGAVEKKVKPFFVRVDLIAEGRKTLEEVSSKTSEFNLHVYISLVKVIHSQISSENNTGRYVGNIYKHREKIEQFDWSNCHPVIL
jgi:hypothetical protein